jgi:hypothetical protein
MDGSTEQRRGTRTCLVIGILLLLTQMRDADDFQVLTRARIKELRMSPRLDSGSFNATTPYGNVFGLFTEKPKPGMPGAMIGGAESWGSGDLGSGTVFIGYLEGQNKVCGGVILNLGNNYSLIGSYNGGAGSVLSTVPGSGIPQGTPGAGVGNQQNGFWLGVQATRK